MICELDDDDEDYGYVVESLIEACDKTVFTAAELKQLLNVISLKVADGFLDYAGADDVIREIGYAAKGLHRISNRRK